MFAATVSPMKNISPVATPIGRNSGLGVGQPRYMQLAQTLLNEIESGKYPVGSQLPTEFDLCDQFGISRSTAREAVKRLVQIGLVVRQPGVGTTVRARTETESCRQSVAGVADLYQYATDTTLIIESSETCEIDAAQAQRLEAAAGETWLHLRGQRHAKEQANPICVTELWLQPAFHSIQGVMDPIELAISTHPADRFSGSSTLQREWGIGAPGDKAS